MKNPSVALAIVITAGMACWLPACKPSGEKASSGSPAPSDTSYNPLTDPYYAIKNNMNVKDPVERAKLEMVRMCLINAKDRTRLYPEETLALCECMKDTVFKHFTIDEIISFESLSPSDRAARYRPVVVRCQSEYVAAVERILSNKNIQQNQSVPPIEIK